MILSFINIHKSPSGRLKTSGFALGFQHFPRDLANVNEWKIMFDPSSNYWLSGNYQLQGSVIGSVGLLVRCKTGQ